MCVLCWEQIALCYVLGRLAVGDVQSALMFIKVGAEALKGKALLDEPAFTISLARRLAGAVLNPKL